MEADFLVVGTDGKISVTSDPDQALNVANASHVYEISPVGRVPVQLCTISGTGSPYTVTSAAIPVAIDGRVKIRK